MLRKNNESSAWWQAARSGDSRMGGKAPVSVARGAMDTSEISDVGPEVGGLAPAGVTRGNSPGFSELYSQSNTKEMSTILLRSL